MQNDLELKRVELARRDQDIDDVKSETGYSTVYVKLQTKLNSFTSEMGEIWDLAVEMALFWVRVLVVIAPPVLMVWGLAKLMSRKKK